MWQDDLTRSLMIATILMTINLGIGIVVTIVTGVIFMSLVANGAAFVEIAILLIIGGCLMARQPLEDKDRYNPDGTATSAWRMAIYGRQMILSAVILFLYLTILGLISYFIPI